MVGHNGSFADDKRFCVEAIKCHDYYVYAKQNAPKA